MFILRKYRSIAQKSKIWNWQLCGLLMLFVNIRITASAYIAFWSKLHPKCLFVGLVTPVSVSDHTYEK